MAIGGAEQGLQFRVDCDQLPDWRHRELLIEEREDLTEQRVGVMIDHTDAGFESRLAAAQNHALRVAKQLGYGRTIAALIQQHRHVNGLRHAADVILIGDAAA
ncbi:hypothetical protein [Paraburkholderia youngii]|uniref:hypothetical protein n=1 Tax=Paraburkholderia youngii TaxID=2782701 RepID=UPI001595996F|nr:hypothetical protein [Paraburkholderia youngii]